MVARMPPPWLKATSASMPAFSAAYRKASAQKLPILVSSLRTERLPSLPFTFRVTAVAPMALAKLSLTEVMNFSSSSATFSSAFTSARSAMVSSLEVTVPSASMVSSPRLFKAVPVWAKTTVLPSLSATSLPVISLWEWPSMKAVRPVVLAITSSLRQGAEASSTPRCPRAMT